MAKQRDTLKDSVVRAKQAGLPRAEVEKTLVDGAREEAGKRGWRPSVLAMTIARYKRIIAEVYGKD
jgi:hypothetical protein